MKKTTGKKSLPKQKNNDKPPTIFNRAVIESLKDYGVFSMDKKGIIKSWNVGAEKLFGYKQKEVLGKNCSLIFTREDQKKGLPTIELKHALVKSRTIDERYFVRKNGSLFWASGIVFPTENKKREHIGFTKILSDISKEKEFDKRKDEFISTASHEIKSPITAMRLFADVIRTKTKKLDSTSLNDSVAGLSGQIDRLVALTDYLLDVSKIQDGKLVLAKTVFNINTQIKLLVATMKLTSTKHTLIYHSTITKNIYADEERISQVITNLISNAIKYSPKGGEVLINAKQGIQGVSVSVQDFGLGVSKSVQHKLFTRFFRADTARKNNIPGIGLGLYIARKIVDGHDGAMRMTSTKGKGSMFSFSLPKKTKTT